MNIEKNQTYTASNEHITSEEISSDEDYQNDLDEEVESDSSTKGVGFESNSQSIFIYVITAQQ